MNWLDKYQNGGNISKLSESEKTDLDKYINKLNSTEPLVENKTANTWGNMLGNVGQYFFGIKDDDLEVSSYKPTIEQHKNYGEKEEKYYSRPGMREDIYKDLTSDKVKKDYNHNGTFDDIYKGLKSNGEDRKHNADTSFPKNKAGYKGMYNLGYPGKLNKAQFNLGRYSVDAGEDEQGKYVSFYDIYDWNGLKTDNSINFYDRIYENQWKDFKNKKMQLGGSVKGGVKGGVIEDDKGQWAHPGKITKINSNDITMKGVNYPVLGVSNTGDEQMMMPGEDYKFDGDSVTEYPMAQDGKTIELDAVHLKGRQSPELKPYSEGYEVEPIKLKQKMKNGGWLDKYNK